MAKHIVFLRTFGASESGATMVEYAIMGGLTAALLILAILGISDYMADAWIFLADTLSNETPFAS